MKPPAAIFHHPSPVAAVLVLCVLCSASARTAEPTPAPSDSVQFVKRRDEIMKADSALFARYAAAADELAELGMYGDALAILEQLVADHRRMMSDTGASESDTSDKNIEWKLGIGTDYFDMNDVVPSSNRAEEQERDTLLRHQQLIYLRAGFDWTPSKLPMLAVKPELYVGNRKASITVGARLRLSDWLRVETNALVEKQFWLDYNTYDSLVAFTRDSSDMLGGEIAIVPGGVLGTKQWRYRIPFGVAVERYVENTPAFTSSVRYSAAPAIEFQSDDNSRTASLQAEIQYRDYGPVTYGRFDSTAQRMVSYQDDSSDFVLLRPELALTYWSGRFSADLVLSYAFNRYPNSVAPQRFDQMSTSVNTAFKLLDFLKPRIALEHIYEAGSYESRIQWMDTVFSIPYAKDSTVALVLNGNHVRIEAEIAVAIGSYLTLSPGVRYETAAYPPREAYDGRDLLAPPYLTESFGAWEPGLRVAVNAGAITTDMRVSYRFENIDDKPYYSRADHTAFRAGGEFSAMLFRRVSAFVLADTELNFYPDASVPATNTAISAGLSARF